MTVWLYTPLTSTEELLRQTLPALRNGSLTFKFQVGAVRCAAAFVFSLQKKRKIFCIKLFASHCGVTKALPALLWCVCSTHDWIWLIAGLLERCLIVLTFHVSCFRSSSLFVMFVCTPYFTFSSSWPSASYTSPFLYLHSLVAVLSILWIVHPSIFTATLHPLLHSHRPSFFPPLTGTHINSVHQPVKT